MSRVCNLLARVLAFVAFAALAIIVAALGAQVLFRHVLDAPLTHSDEIAQTGLVWLTFAGAAYLYRERGHVEIDFVVGRLPPAIARSVEAIVELAILTVMLLICVQVLQTRDITQRVVYGTLQLPRFILHFLPLLLGAASTALFSVEAIVRRARGAAK